MHERTPGSASCLSINATSDPVVTMTAADMSDARRSLIVLRDQRSARHQSVSAARTQVALVTYYRHQKKP